MTKAINFNVSYFLPFQDGKNSNGRYDEDNDDQEGNCQTHY